MMMMMMMMVMMMMMMIMMMLVIVAGNADFGGAVVRAFLFIRTALVVRK